MKFEKLDKVASSSPLLKRIQAQFIEPVFVAKVFEMLNTLGAP
jgi:hypothetical protein